MERKTEIDLIERALAHIAARTTDRDPGPTTIPVDDYVSEARHAREIETIFRRVPMPIGRASQIPSPGDFFTHDANGVAILVVRGDDGAVHAFLNVCRHRGTRVEPTGCGHKKSFVCPYHAWTYGRDGALLGIPHQDGFPNVDKSTRGLVPLPTAVIGGFVWVSASPAGTRLDIPAFLGPIVKELDGLGVTSAHMHAPTITTKELSWKLAIDVFLEAYHLKPTHHASIYGLFFDNIGLVDRAGPHLRNIFPKRSIRDLEGTPKESWSLRRHANVLYHFFPSTFVLVEPDHAATVQIFPDGPTRSKLVTYMLVPDAPVTDKARAYWAANDRILRDATDEDFTMGESIQRGFGSGANTELVFGAFEHALAHFHEQIDRFVA